MVLRLNQEIPDSFLLIKRLFIDNQLGWDLIRDQEAKQKYLESLAFVDGSKVKGDNKCDEELMQS